MGAMGGTGTEPPRTFRTSLLRSTSALLSDGGPEDPTLCLDRPKLTMSGDTDAEPPFRLPNGSSSSMRIHTEKCILKLGTQEWVGEI
ncbi:unnamed protein product [Acanthoscelides obtectus]|uniref:Uncharacterized protein n=1 Tax=Acanthoscelides obtectus TaxID=200917 RepID=A0A9P0L2J9_ACAOB|nr:unnamed protein product [Acanthoscelides obtectus]CAK1624082.1 hypothetical protein AOBTE_LOCUS2316 [Acanthoscelides obtectus]